MDKDHIKPQEDQDRERRPEDPPSPRGNPETDHEAVEKGQEQLEKVSGN